MLHRGHSSNDLRIFEERLELGGDLNNGMLGGGGIGGGALGIGRLEYVELTHLWAHGRLSVSGFFAAGRVGLGRVHRGRRLGVHELIIVLCPLKALAISDATLVER